MTHQVTVQVCQFGMFWACSLQHVISLQLFHINCRVAVASRVGIDMSKEHYSKWKLNKTEQKQADDDEKALVSQLLAAGKDQKEAKEEAAKAKDLQVKALGVGSSLVGTYY